MGAATVCSTTSALAPAYWVDTLTVGGVICGNWATGRPMSARIPASVITMEMTKANFGRLMKKTPALPLAIFWPNQDGAGVHMNVSGAGITKYSDNKGGAIRLLEWLAGSEAQSQFAALNMEYPANPDIKPDAIVSSWGTFKGSPLNVAKYGELQTDAIKLMDKAGYK